MISYAWKNKQHKDCTRRIARKLKKVFRDVWLDCDDLHGDMLDSMSKAIWKANVMLLFVDEQFEKSEVGCKNEVEYIRTLNKPFVPLLYGDFRPSKPGWLSFFICAQWRIRIKEGVMIEREEKELFEKILKEIFLKARRKVTSKQIEDVVRIIMEENVEKKMENEEEKKIEVKGETLLPQFNNCFRQRNCSINSYDFSLVVLIALILSYYFIFYIAIMIILFS